MLHLNLINISLVEPGGALSDTASINKLYFLNFDAA